MKKTIIISLIAVILISSLISGEIIINQQPESLYNTGDIVKTSFKIITSTDFDPDTFFLIELLCNGLNTKVMQIPVGDIKSGEERQFNPPIPLLTNLLGKTTGNCKIKAVLESISEKEYEYVLTNEFEISDLINIKLKTEKSDFAPQENIIIEGEATKENGKAVKGIVELTITKGNESLIEKTDTIKNGYFYLNFSLPKESEAKKYSAKVEVYEIDSNAQKTNQGSAEIPITIKQIPTSLEIIFENSEIEPGKTLKIKAVLHDQTGEKIISKANITIENNGEILEKTERKTDEFFEFYTAYNQAPSEWKITAISNEIETEANCKIKEKEDLKLELMNKTIIITNIGNVPYNKSVQIKIGNESKEIDINLKVDESQEYILNAPNGEYEIEVATKEGNVINGKVILTGKTIEVKEADSRIGSLVKHPLVWIFIIAILGVIAFLIFKKGHKKIFFGRIHLGKKKETKTTNEKHSHVKQQLIPSKNKAELSLSIKGNKQNVNIVCLKLKNFKEIKLKKSNATETLQKVVESAEDKKAFVYESHDNLFFILAPTRTRTFKNEKIAIKIAQGIEEILKEHNKIFKQKIDFGISLNYGTIIAKHENGILEFMSMGTLITSAKKIASEANKEILLSEKVKDRLGADVKTIKEHKNKIEVYKIKEIKDREQNKKFIQKFIKRMEKEKSS